MRRTLICITLLLTGLVCSAAGQQQIPTVTVCELANATDSQHGREVRLDATVVLRHETSRLTSEGCEIAYAFPDSPNVKAGLTLEKNQSWYCFDALVKAPSDEPKPSECPTCRKFSVSATFVGRVEVAAEGKGFGHLNLAKVRLVIRSVSNVRAVERQQSSASHQEPSCCLIHEAAHTK